MAKEKNLSYLSNLGALGSEDITREDLKTPYIKIVEKLSDDIESGLKYGDIINSITKEKLDDENGDTEIIVLRHLVDYKVVEDGSVVDYSRDGKTWTSGHNYPVDDLWKYKTYNFIVVLLKDLESENPTLYKMYLSKGRAKAARELLNAIAIKCIDKGMPIFAKPFKLKKIEVQNKDNKKYYTFQIKDGSIEYITAAQCEKITAVRELVEDKRVQTALLEDRL